MNLSGIEGDHHDEILWRFSPKKELKKIAKRIKPSVRKLRIEQIRDADSSWKFRINQ